MLARTIARRSWRPVATHGCTGRTYLATAAIRAHLITKDYAKRVVATSRISVTTTYGCRGISRDLWPVSKKQELTSFIPLVHSLVQRVLLKKLVVHLV